MNDFFQRVKCYEFSAMRKHELVPLYMWTVHVPKPCHAKITHTHTVLPYSAHSISQIFASQNENIYTHTHSLKFAGESPK